MPKVKELNEEIAAAQAGQAAVKAAKASTPKAPKDNSPKVPEGGRILRDERTEKYPGGYLVLDSEGHALNKKGERDKRWSVPFEQAQSKTSSTGGGQGKSKAERMAEKFGNEQWDLVLDPTGKADHTEPNGVKSLTGASLKTYFKVRGRTTGREGFVGAGELPAFFGIQVPSKAKSKAGPKVLDQEIAFADGEPVKAGPEPKGKKGKAKVEDIDVDAAIAELAGSTA